MCLKGAAHGQTPGLHSVALDPRCHRVPDRRSSGSTARRAGRDRPGGRRVRRPGRRGAGCPADARRRAKCMGVDPGHRRGLGGRLADHRERRGRTPTWLADLRPERGTGLTGHHGRRPVAARPVPRQAEGHVMTTETITAVLLIAVPIAFNVAFFELGRSFDYPNILRKEPDEILRRFAAGGSGLILRWEGLLISALLMLPLATLLAVVLAAAPAL